MAYEDLTLQCSDCGCDFVFTAGEQEFFASKGLTNHPKRCNECRTNRKRSSRGERALYDAVCAECGCETQVPFRPTEDKPVYCRDCFKKARAY